MIIADGYQTLSTHIFEAESTNINSSATGHADRSAPHRVKSLQLGWISRVDTPCCLFGE